MVHRSPGPNSSETPEGLISSQAGSSPELPRSLGVTVNVVPSERPQQSPPAWSTCARSTFKPTSRSCAAGDHVASCVANRQTPPDTSLIYVQHARVGQSGAHDCAAHRAEQVCRRTLQDFRALLRRVVTDAPFASPRLILRSFSHAEVDPHCYEAANESSTDALAALSAQRILEYPQILKAL